MRKFLKAVVSAPARLANRGAPRRTIASVRFTNAARYKRARTNHLALWRTCLSAVHACQCLKEKECSLKTISAGFWST